MACHKKPDAGQGILEFNCFARPRFGRLHWHKYAVGLWVNEPVRLDAISDLKFSARITNEKVLKIGVVCYPSGAAAALSPPTWDWKWPNSATKFTS